LRAAPVPGLGVGKPMDTEAGLSDS
jgi:hypothetical protein